MDSPGRKYTISGVNVQFPCNAYPTQIAMMHKILQGLEREQNCLLESPTGSGKSLALLCSCLAWQAAEYEKLRLEEEEEDDTCCKKESDEENCGCSCHTIPTGANNIPEELSTSKYFPAVPDPPALSDHDYTGGAAPNPTVSPNEDDFQPAKKKFRTPGGGMQSSRVRGVVFEDDEEMPNTPPTPAQWKMELTNNSTSTNQMLCTCNCGKKEEERKEETEERPRKKKRAPKIFFGTRTHKQIAQITRELGKTAYKGARMTILSSREHTCINSSIRGNKNDGCRELLDHKACSFHHNVVRMSNQAQIQYKGLSAWDIEELVKLGRKIKACPYYAARELMLEADIVFCPYNYLVDPVIRENMQISLKNHVIVLDEAHNIEDSAREAASFSMTEDQLDLTMTELEDLVLHNVKMDDHRALHIVCGSFKKWIKDSSSLLKERDYERQTKVQTGMDMVAVLNSMGINPDTFGMLKKNLSAVTDPENKPEQKQGQEQMWLGSASAQMLKGMFFVLGFLFKENMKFAEDYRVVIERTVEYSNRPEHFPNGYVRMKKGRGMDKTFSHHLHFWCLNPAVAFSELANCRAIVLSSGTLSPIDSFQSELGVPFPIQLEANHVVGKKQVWVGTVGAGPRGRKLMATYQHTETYEFQDELGQLVLQVCQTISHGVLCFLPSYKLLGKLCQRWQMTRLWEQIQEHKQVIREPQGGDKADFDDILKQFYDAIKCSEDTENRGGHGGALFLAVCRGKVSEGLDFADNNARAVITVGIPYPNFKDLQVELKQNYNNQHSGTRGLLTGRQWYEIQAYRALNQALGRCIRHKRDWGALILVDDRFAKGQGRYTKGLSKWVRQRVQHFNAFGSVVSSLTQFSTQMTEGSATSLDDSVAMTPQASPHPSRSFLDTSVSTPDPSSMPQPGKLNAFQHLMGQSPLLDQKKRTVDTTPVVNKFEPQGFIPSTPGTGPKDHDKNITQDVSLSDKKTSSISKGKLKALFKKNVQQRAVTDSAGVMGTAQVKVESSEVKGDGFMTPAGDNRYAKSTPVGDKRPTDAIPTPKGRLLFEEDNIPRDTKDDTTHQGQRLDKGDVKNKGHSSKTLSAASRLLAQFAYKSKEESSLATEDAEIAGPLTESCKKVKEENLHDQNETKDGFNQDAQDRLKQPSGPNNAKVNTLFKFVNIGPLTTPVHSTAEPRKGMATPPLQETSAADMDFTPPLFDDSEPTAEENTSKIYVGNIFGQKGKLNDNGNDENESKEDDPPVTSRGRKRQLSLSAKKSTEKRRNSASEKKPAAGRQSNKKKLFRAFQDENDGPSVDESQPALKIRRSFRSRRKANCPVLSEDPGDFLDDLMTAAQSKEANQAHGPCSPGLHCIMCGTELVSSVEDVHVEKETSTYIQEESRSLSSLRRRQSEGMKCQCDAPQMEGRSPPTKGGMVLIDRTRLEGKVQSMSPQKSAKGPHLNSYLSEEDQCLYVPVVCAGCKAKSPTEKTILGFNIISLGNGKPTTKGWLYYGALWHCPHLQLTK